MENNCLPEEKTTTQQELVWPRGVGLLGALAGLAGVVAMHFWGVSQVLTITTLSAYGLCACGALAVICDRQRIQRSEIEALRAEITALRLQSRDVSD